MKKAGLIFLSALFCMSSFIAGCSLAPEYKRPDSPVSDSWPKGEAYKGIESVNAKMPASDIKWKDFLVNDQLQKVVELSLKNNRDLRVAALNIEKTRALYQIQRSELFPNVKSTASKFTQGLPETLSGVKDDSVTTQYTFNVGISSYELDMFGRIASLKDKALEQYLATEQARSSAQISLVAEVTAEWLTLAADHERLKLAKDTLKAQQETYDMIKRRFEVGASSELDLRQVQTRVEAAKIDIARYTGKVAQDENALILLVGSPVPADLMPSELGTIESKSGALKDVKAGLSSDVLLKRPDILSAENQLKAANANIGAARAAFFPKISITGTYGVASGQLSDLFSSSQAWTFSPQISVPIFDGGLNQANLEAAEADQKIAVAKYEKTIQTAFREVADALAQRGTVDDQMKAQKSFLEATSESYRLSDARYKSGIDSYLNVLDAQRSLYSAQQSMIDVRLQKLSNMVTLYKVLGGGAVD
ncbi:AdeC/AdeK/OprM family multidrug efflux complex outer membrane factor [Desulforegula conservatrix]|uniref:AdeC/AdeK/OprM family multidrug efflux complex outer membrane factor n=1 Tax=Desulforegula conservatrix TaxID=153026 RepID=UPI000427EAE6|nr:AdeC/AdeK/OprM family multidrug efflux complex outer membrane factor [Desulforegula conservatrix]